MLTLLFNFEDPWIAQIPPKKHRQQWHITLKSQIRVWRPYIYTLLSLSLIWSSSSIHEGAEFRGFFERVSSSQWRPFHSHGEHYFRARCRSSPTYPLGSPRCRAWKHKEEVLYYESETQVGGRRCHGFRRRRRIRVRLAEFPQPRAWSPVVWPPQTSGVSLCFVCASLVLCHFLSSWCKQQRMHITGVLGAGGCSWVRLGLEHSLSVPWFIPICPFQAYCSLSS
jgi:hypothetical protein